MIEMSDILGYKGKRVIVSGCFSGMGEATAKILLDLGAEVHGLDFKPCALPLASFNLNDLRDPLQSKPGLPPLAAKSTRCSIALAFPVAALSRRSTRSRSTSLAPATSLSA